MPTPSELGQQGAIPENAKLIYGLLRTAGLNPNAAAGILGNIEQESGGNPNAGSYPDSYGLIQWTPATHWGVPDNSSVTAQVGYIIKYINALGSISAINKAATSPSAAALYFSNNYEKPAPALANNANREASANLVAAAAKSGNWKASGSPNPPSGSGTGGWLSFLTDPLGAAEDMLKVIEFVINPLSWLRILAGMAGFVFLLAGLFMMAKAM